MIKIILKLFPSGLMLEEPWSESLGLYKLHKFMGKITNKNYKTIKLMN